MNKDTPLSLSDERKILANLLTVAEHLSEWCTAVPEDIPLPAMPGLDGDFIAETLNSARAVLAVAGEQSTPPFTERQNKLLQFALFRFAGDAMDRATAAAQDKNGKHFKAGAFEMFMKDAEDAEELLTHLRLRPQQSDKADSVHLTCAGSEGAKTALPGEPA